MKRSLFLFNAILAIVSVFLLNSCSENSSFSEESSSGLTTIDNFKIKQFEERYVKTFYDTISSSENSKKLIGYKVIYYSDEQRKELLSIPNYKKYLDDIKSIYYADDLSFIRVYFPMSDAIVSINNQIIEANQNGIIVFPQDYNNFKTISSFEIIGRKSSDNVVGTDNNIISGDKIYLQKSLPSFQSSSDSNYYVFDLGERVDHAHNESGHESTDKGAGIACYKNHRSKNCSTAFGYNGRCTREYTKCMDYNGYPAQCASKSKIGFAGSDCQRAMARGQCWNEL